MNLITSKISIDLMRPSEPPVVHAVQGERNVRSVQMSIFCDGEPWQIPENVSLGIRYGRVTRTGGYYDSLPDGACAWKYQGNMVTITLAPQMMTCSGSVYVQVEIRHEDQVLATFPFRLQVAVNPAIEISEPEMYVNWLQWLEKELDEYIDKIHKSGELFGGTMAGPINMNGHPISGLSVPTANDQAANMGFVNQQMRKAAPRNLLDNSDFRNPVNQRGNSSYGGTGYGIDRWKAWHNGNGYELTLHDGYITFASAGHATLVQHLPKGVLDLGKNYTLAKQYANGELHVENTQESITEGVNSDFVTIASCDNSEVSLCWAALYEGEYTAETLPEYRPKGYGAELAECQRYYANSWFGLSKGDACQQIGQVWSSTQADFLIYFPRQMRLRPTMTFYGSAGRENPNVYNGGYYEVSAILANHRLGLSGTYARVTKGATDPSTWAVNSVIQLHAHWEASADL